MICQNNEKWLSCKLDCWNCSEQQTQWVLGVCVHKLVVYQFLPLFSKQFLIISLLCVLTTINNVFLYRKSVTCWQICGICQSLQTCELQSCQTPNHNKQTVGGNSILWPLTLVYWSVQNISSLRFPSFISIFVINKLNSIYVLFICT